VLEKFGAQARERRHSNVPAGSSIILLLSTLAGLGASLSKFAFDVRVLASPGFGDIAEPRSARNRSDRARCRSSEIPVMAERIDSLARLLPAYADVALAECRDESLLWEKKRPHFGTWIQCGERGEQTTRRAHRSLLVLGRKGGCSFGHNVSLF